MRPAIPDSPVLPIPAAFSVLGVVLLVALAGCAGLPSFGHDYPPGVSASGVQNATALADAHQEALREGYRVDEVTTYRAANGSVIQRIESTTRWSQTERSVVITFADPHAIFGVEARVYSNASGTWLRTERASGHVAFQTGVAGDWRALIAGPGGEWGPVYAMAAAPNTTTTTLANGSTRVTVDGGYLGRGNTSGTMTVTPDGLVERYTLTYDSAWRNQPARVHTVRSYSQVGAPNVTRPDWVANATR